MILTSQAPVGKRVEVEFIDGFDIETHFHENRDCDYDYIQFQDGPYHFSQNLTGRLCGEESQYKPIVSTTRHMRIVFKTDGHSNKAGFKMKFRYENLTKGKLFQ